MEQDGSAVDAVIAAGLCNSVMNIQSMGLGGGHFMNIYLKYIIKHDKKIKKKRLNSN